MIKLIIYLNFNAQVDSKDREYFKELESAARQLNMFHSDKHDLILKGFNENITL